MASSLALLDLLTRNLQAVTKPDGTDALAARLSRIQPGRKPPRITESPENLAPIGVQR